MDGNGRWAEQKGLPRLFGHQSGVNSVKKVVEVARKNKINYLTLYAFSQENWNRPKEEIGTLMKLLVETLRDEFEDLLSNNIKLNAIGNLSLLPVNVQKELKDIIFETSNNSGMTLTLALSYGSRQELINAVKEISLKVKNDLIDVEKIDDSLIKNNLYNPNLPDVDLLIRTSGEKRISNFLLWQIAYSELYFTDKYWPDFDENEFTNALIEYKKRERRFGKTSKQL
ncbi:MAG: isoprenyl transferase [Bacteroidota bacterium]